MILYSVACTGPIMTDDMAILPIKCDMETTTHIVRNGKKIKKDKNRKHFYQWKDAHDYLCKRARAVVKEAEARLRHAKDDLRLARNLKNDARYFEIY